MGDAVVGPITEWLKLCSRAGNVFGSRVVAGFFQPEGIEGRHDPVALLGLRPARQSSGRSVTGPMEATQMTVHLECGHVSDEIEWVAHQVLVEKRHRRGPVANDRVR